MNLKCGNGHELSGDQKFCGECGAPAAEHAQCASCAATMAKAAKFCGDCGTAAGATDAPEPALDAALDDMNAFLKASAGYEEELLALPEIDDDEGVNQAAVDAIIERARVVDPETHEALGIDAVPVVGEMFKAQQLGHTIARAHTEHLTAGLHHLFDGQTRMAKSQVAILGMVKSIAADVAALTSAPRGRRAVAVMPAAATPDGRARAAKGGPAGVDLMAKAVLAARQNGALLSITDISKLESYTNDGWGLSQIAEVDPQLAATVDRALTATAAA